MQLKVHILTTVGVASVQQLTPQDPRLRSVICEEGTYTPLPISPDYHHFVSASSGIVQHYFGDHSYRTEVSLPITSGSSWQLGILIAHWAHANLKLNSGQRMTGVKHLLVSGRVNQKLDVLPVEHLNTKLDLAIQWIASHDIPMESCAVIIPDNSEVSSRFSAHLRIQRIGQVESLSESLGLPRLKLKKTRHVMQSSPRRLIPAFGFLAAAFFTLAMWVSGSIMPTWQTLSALEQSGRYRELLTELRKLRDSRDLMQVNVALIFEEVLRKQSERIDRLHPLSLTVPRQTAACPEPVYQLTSSLDVPSHIYRDCTPKLDVTNDADSPTILWVHHFNRIQEGSLHLLQPSQSLTLHDAANTRTSRIILVSSKRPISDIFTWLETLQKSDTIDRESIDRFLRAGISIRIITLPNAVR